MSYLSNKIVRVFVVVVVFREVGVGIGRDITFLCNIKSLSCFISFDLYFNVVRTDIIIPILQL